MKVNYAYSINNVSYRLHYKCKNVLLMIVRSELVKVVLSRCRTDVHSDKCGITGMNYFVLNIKVVILKNIFWELFNPCSQYWNEIFYPCSWYWDEIFPPKFQIMDNRMNYFSPKYKSSDS